MTKKLQPKELYPRKIDSLKEVSIEERYARMDHEQKVSKTYKKLLGDNTAGIGYCSGYKHIAELMAQEIKNSEAVNQKIRRDRTLSREEKEYALHLSQVDLMNSISRISESFARAAQDYAKELGHARHMLALEDSGTLPYGTAQDMIKSVVKNQLPASRP